MKRSFLAHSFAACIAFGFANPLLAAETTATETLTVSPPAQQPVVTVEPAEQCLTDLRSFDSEMRKEGYWFSGSTYGYGYPMMDGYGFAEGGVPQAGSVMGYQNARPGYNLRTLIAAANILARDGQQQACESVLSASRDTYKLYVASMLDRNAPMADLPGWRQRQLSAAHPVTGMDTSIRSDQLVGTEVLNPQNEELGSVDDIVMSPQTNKIAYLIIARGGIFGFGEKYIAVPWQDFKMTPSASLLVLDTTKKIMADGPLVSRDKFGTSGQFDNESQKIDTYWKAHLTNTDTTKTSP